MHLQRIAQRFYGNGVTGMGKYILKRCVSMVFILVTTAFIIFTILYFAPADPADALLGAGASEIEREALRESWGLNEPYLKQLGDYMYQTFIKFDFGESWLYGVPVFEELMNRLPRTLFIGITAMVCNVTLGVLLGVFAGTHEGKWQDSMTMGIAMIFVSCPDFWVALMMVILFSAKLNWLPAYGIGGIEYYIMPCLANCLAGIASQARQTRSSMLEVIRSDYVTTARAKGLSERDILMKHALPNALIPIITIVGNGMGMMLGGTVVIENVFAIPGIGSYMTNAISSRDYPIVQGGVLVLGIIFSLIMLLVDIIYAFVDPRIKAQYEGKQRKRRQRHAS